MLTKELINIRCVYCNSGSISLTNDVLHCDICSKDYPIVNKIPIIINEEKSIFRNSDFVNNKNLFFNVSSQSTIKNKILYFIPSLSLTKKISKNNYYDLLKYFPNNNENKKYKVLIIGGSIKGNGIEVILSSSKVTPIESDVSFGPRTSIVFDAHDIPYKDEIFDGVIVQAVLEHVVDSRRCVEEIFRVLKNDGLVYAETQFLQQVHGGPYDFTRYTRSGHRILFKEFIELKSGIIGGPGTVLAWSYQYFLISLFGYSKILINIIKVFSRLTGFWLKYFDKICNYNKRSEDMASGFFFLGKKTSELPKLNIIEYYH